MAIENWDLAKLIAGLGCILVAALLMLFGESDSTTAGAVIFLILGLASIVASRKKA